MVVFIEKYVIKMKITLFLLVVGIIPCFSQYDSILHNSINRTYLLHLPPSYIPGNNMPLVIAMHGGFGWGSQLQNQSQLSIKSDNAGFIVVYPEGVKSPFGIRTWNAGGCCGYAMNNNIDDVGFISNLIDSLAATYSIDTQRIYATGMSNGAFMSYRLACERSDKIAAIAPVAGSMNMNVCNPTRGVPVIHFHSFQDNNVPYQGGIGAGTSNHYNPPLDSVLNSWAQFNSCTVNNDTIINNLDYLHVNFKGCNCGNELNLYLTHDGGHSWPGGLSTSSGDPVSTVISANDLMWSFFQQHTLICSATNTENIAAIKGKMQMYPNPLTEEATFVIPEFSGDKYQLKIYDNLGKIHTPETIKNKNGFSMKKENLLPGIYFFKITNAEKMIGFGKFIIQ